MNIAVSSTTKTLEGDIDQRFGRCHYFLIIDSETLEFTVIDNESAMTSGGAGIKAAETIVQSNAEVVITGNIGPNAFQILSTGNITMYTGVSGGIKKSINQYNQGKLQETTHATVGSHAGMGK